MAEAPNQGNCNCYTTAINAPCRCGSYADLDPGRTNTGGGYYGALDLSGNLWEHTVTVGHASGRTFTGLHGDGELTTNGDADVTAWPGAGAAGTGFRGGAWQGADYQVRVSDRGTAAYLTAIRSTAYGCRAARSAP